MEWCKLYASLPRDRDLRRAGEAATLLFVFGLCYVADEETDGFIDDDALPDFRLPKVQQRADALVRVGVWDRVSDGYVIPNWKSKQRELYAIMEKRRRDADRMSRKRKESRDGRATGRGKVAPESREKRRTPLTPGKPGEPAVPNTATNPATTAAAAAPTAGQSNGRHGSPLSRTGAANASPPSGACSSSTTAGLHVVLAATRRW